MLANRAFLEQFLEALMVLRRDLYQRGKIGDGLFEVVDQGRVISSV